MDFIIGKDTEKAMAIILEDKEKNPEQKLIEAKAVFKMMYYEIIDVLREFLVLNEEQYKIISLWIIGTYAHQYFNTYPYLFLNAMRGSGKTRTLKLISALGANGDGSILNNLTDAVLFRIPKGTTTCIDEVEQINSKEKQTLRELFNSAYKKGMKVKRMKKTHRKNEEGKIEEVHVPEEFEPYFPIAMANISGMDEVLGDRAITIVLEKSDHPITTKKNEDFSENLKIKWISLTLRNFSRVVEFLANNEYLYKWNYWLDFKGNTTYSTTTTNNTHTTNTTTNKAIQRYIEMTKRDIKISEEEDRFFKRLDEANITGRNFELFMPLLILAEFIDKDIFEDMYEIIKNLAKHKKEEEYHESTDISLFNFIVGKSDDDNFLRIKELVKEFAVYIGEEDNQSKERWLNEKWFGRALKRLNLVLDKRHYQGCVQVRLNYAKAREKLKIFKW